MNFKSFIFDLPSNIGKYKIKYIDGNKFRSSSIEHEEFCSYAIHEDFPDKIKKDEIFIDKHLNENDSKLILRSAIQRLKDLKSGMSSEKAYDQSIKFEKSLREKAKLQHKDKEDKFTKHGKKYLTIKDDKFPVNVYLVSGKEIRDKYKTDFSQGGHGYVYPWIPHNEIWIEKEVDPKEYIYILAHEYTELLLMRDKKMKYEEAHIKASGKEMHFRHLHKSIDINKILDEIKGNIG